MVKSAVVRYFKTGSVEETKRPVRPPSAIPEGNMNNIVTNVEVRPKQSPRVKAEKAGTSKDSVHKMLKKQKIIPLKSKLVH